MKRVKQMIMSAARQATGRDAPAVPLMVPHGGGDAGRDFESAFDVLERNERTRELWRGERVKIPFVPES